MHAGVRHAIVATPNVTPMIDVMLVLLIIFMVVTPTLMEGMHAEPPFADHARAHPQREGDHTLAIDAHGAFFLGGQPVSAAALGPAIAARFPAGATDRMLYVRAHKDLPYRTVRDAMEVAREHGVASVGLITERPPRP